MSNPIDNPTSGEIYEIRLKGHISETRFEWLKDVHIEHTSEGQTILRGKVIDQSALHGLLNKIRDLNITLISVEKLNRSEQDMDF